MVARVLAIGTLVFSSSSLAQLTVAHGETLAAAQAMFEESVARFFVAALSVAALAGVALAIFILCFTPAPIQPTQLLGK